MSENREERTLLVDASVFITLAGVDHVDLLRALAGDVVVPRGVADEIETDPAAARLESADRSGWITVPETISTGAAREAAEHLGSSVPEEPSGGGWIAGDVALLGRVLAADDAIVVVVTDDKPLRNACKSLGIELSGSIGVLVAAVERGHLGPETAKNALEAMDEVGARLSASLLKRAERLIDEAAQD